MASADGRRPPRMSVKYASTSSSRFGLPHAISNTAVWLLAMDDLHPSLQVLDRAGGQHPVAKVEKVARPAARGLDHATSAVLDQGPRSRQQGGIQVALDASLVPDHAPGLAEVDA